MQALIEEALQSQVFPYELRKKALIAKAKKILYKK
jgi:hypothetical protein